MKEFRTLIFCVFSVVIVLCMTFPIIEANGRIFDLRYVPLIIAYFYFGHRFGLGLLTVMMIYRVFLGGEGLVGSLFESVRFLLIMYPFYSVYQRVSLNRKCLILTIIYLLNFLLSIFIYSILHTTVLSFMYTQFQVYVIQLLVSILIVYFVEAIKRNITIFEQVKKVEKIEVVSHMAASVSHEVRNPLTVSRGFLQLVKNDDLPPHKKEQYIDIAIAEMDRAKNIIHDYLTFAKPATNSEEPIDLHQEVKTAVHTITPSANMNAVEIVLQNSGKGRVLGDRQKFLQCLLNILKNSIDTMPDGGTLQMTTFNDREAFIIEVSDTGTGMTQSEINRLGEPYFSTKTNGTGLGMMVVFRIVESMKGTISISSEVNQGTQFVLRFPLSREGKEG